MMNKKFIFAIWVISVGLAAHWAQAASLDEVQTAVIEEDYVRAGEMAKAFLAKNPPSDRVAEAKYLLGLSALYQGQYGQARKVFDNLLGHCPNARLQDRVAIGRIDSFLLEGKYEIAFREAEKLLKKSPASEYQSLIYLKLARASFKQGDWAGAKNYLQKIVSRFPDSPEYYSAKQLLEEKQFFTVQVGAFLEEGRARTLVEELKAQGLYAFTVETVNREARHFYRVRVGELSTVAEAEQLKQQLVNLGYPTLIYP